MEPLKETGIKFDGDLVSELIEETGRYPYFIQFYCREILSNVDKRHILLDDFKSIKRRIEKKLDTDFFDKRFADTSDMEKKILFAMASSDPGNTSSQISSCAGIAQNTLRKAMTRLKRKGLVYGNGPGSYNLSLPLFANYLKRKSQRD